MNKLGDFIRSNREQNNMLLRHLAVQLDMDIALLSKIERGERMAKREIVQKLSEIFKTPKDQLMTLWLTDQLFELLKNEPKAIGALENTKNELLKIEPNNNSSSSTED